MIERLLSLFREPQEERNEHTIEVACAALLAEIMHADHTLEKEEVQALRDVLGRLFRLSTEETDALLQSASLQVRQSNDLFQFTKVVNEAFSAEEKYRLIYGLWQVAYSDSQLDKYEEHMVRKLADLLYVPHSEFIRARNEARDRKSSGV